MEVCEQFDASKSYSSHGMNTLLERHIPSKLTQEKMDNPTSSTSVTKIKFVVKNLSTKKIIGPEGFPGASHQTFKGEIMQILPIFCQKGGETSPIFLIRSGARRGFQVSSLLHVGGCTLYWKFQPVQ